jgi:hypothetical protein
MGDGCLLLLLLMKNGLIHGGALVTPPLAPHFFNHASLLTIINLV